MKIVGQSTQVDGMPYVHLGYLAATYTKPNMPLFSGGLVALTVGVAMAFSVVVSKTASGWPAFNFVRRRSKKLVVGGFALILIGGIAVALAVAYKEEGYALPVAMTHIKGLAILRAVAARQEQGQPVPNDLVSLGLSTDVLTDGWTHPMRFVAADSGGLKGYSILSAGPDGSFGSADDIRMSLGEDGQLSTDENHLPTAEGP